MENVWRKHEETSIDPSAFAFRLFPKLRIAVPSKLDRQNGRSGWTAVTVASLP